MKSISIVMPAYNEEGCIYNSLARLKKTLEKMKIEHEIIVVNDGSTDNTVKEAERAARKFGNIKIVGYKRNKGKGYAIKFGARKASKEVIEAPFVFYKRRASQSKLDWEENLNFKNYYSIFIFGN